MDHPISQIAQSLQSAYDEQYTEQLTEWRELGGKYKAANILHVCKNHSFSKVLECGAGEGSILRFLDESGVFPELHAIEISDSGIRQIQKRHLRRLKEVKAFDGYSIPYADKEFDMAYCSHVIEHVEHPRLLLREMRRISKFQIFEIPLDYSIGVDENISHFLAYGHINIYTPSLFKFLLKSEGYKVIDERLTHIDNEVTRYSWYKNLNIRKNIRSEMSLHLRPLYRLLRRIGLGEGRYKECGYSAYTCLAEGTSELKIFQSSPPREK